MKFSLILATLARTTELKRFLASLAAQTHQQVELIVVDQNPDERLSPILADVPSRIEFKHLRSSPGLSRARNAGLAACTGEVIAIPDDDCWYPPHLLANVATWLRNHPAHGGVAGRTLAETGPDSCVSGRIKATDLDRRSVWLPVSISIFLRRNVTIAVGEFDETLGVGAGTPWGSGEETDYLLRAMGSGHRIGYAPTIVVGHPDPVAHYDAKAIGRALSYGRGFGRVLRKHNYPTSTLAVKLLRALAGATLGLLRLDLGMAHFHWNVFKGRLAGWMS